MKKILVEGKYSHGAKLYSKGKHEKIHKGRDYVGYSSIPYDWTKALVRNYTQPIKNQYQAGMCGGELYSQAMQIYRTLVLGLPFQELSEISFYSQNYASGGGMTIDAMSNGASFKGLTTFQNVPTPVNCTEQQSESTKWENTTTLADCLLKSGIQMVSVHRDIDSIAQAIRDYKFVGFMVGGQNGQTPSWLSFIPSPPTPNTNSNPLWGHFLCSTTNIPIPVNGKKLIPFYQSWGDSVGDKGIQYFDENYINSGYIYDAFTFTKFLFNKDLQLGSTGTDVKYLQVKLGMPSNTFGFGIFGPKTLAVVKSYQLKNGITPTGYCGILTRNSLNSKI